MKDITLRIYHDLSGKIRKNQTRLEGTRTTYQPAPLAIRQSLRHDESNFLTGTNQSVVLDASQQDGWYAYQSPKADGNWFTHSVVLLAGDYTFYVRGVSNSDAGIVDWYLNDILIEAGQDWYSAAPVYNVIKSTSVTIPTSRIQTLRGIINGKNPASNDYALYLTIMWFKQGTD